LNNLKQQQMENNHVTQFDAHFQHKLDIMTERGAISDAMEEATLKIAKNLLNLEVSIDKIMASTGLTKQQIEQLKN